LGFRLFDDTRDFQTNGLTLVEQKKPVEFEKEIKTQSEKQAKKVTLKNMILFPGQHWDLLKFFALTDSVIRLIGYYNYRQNALKRLNK
jgi:hypothetical protein